MNTLAMSNTCFNSVCVCSDDRSRVSCIGAGFTTVESVCESRRARRYLDSCDRISTLIMRGNQIESININSILDEMPYLKMLDLRDQLSDLCGPREIVAIQGVKIYFSNICSGQVYYSVVQTTPHMPLQQTTPTVNQSTSIQINVLLWSTMSTHIKTVTETIVHEHDSTFVKVLKVYINVLLSISLIPSLMLFNYKYCAMYRYVVKHHCIIHDLEFIVYIVQIYSGHHP